MRASVTVMLVKGMLTVSMRRTSSSLFYFGTLRLIKNDSSRKHCLQNFQGGLLTVAIRMDSIHPDDQDGLLNWSKRGCR
jgi:hypothetical protein